MDNHTLRPTTLEGSGGVHMLGWNVAPEDLYIIPEHWFSFPEPDRSHHLYLGIVYCFVFVIGVIGNGLVIWIFSTAKSLRTTSNMFVLNLAVADLIMILHIPMFLYNSFSSSFVIGPVFCEFYGAVTSLSSLTACATNVCIAYDRHRTITRQFEAKISQRTALGLVVFCWVCVLPYIIGPLFKICSRFVPEGFLTTCSYDYLTEDASIRYFVLAMFINFYAIPLALIAYFYFRIVVHVVRHEELLRAQARVLKVGSVRSNKSIHMEVRIAKTAIIISSLYILAWTPYAVVNLIGAFGDKSLITPFATMIPAVAAKCVACVDPYVYAISHPRYRAELMSKLSCLCGRQGRRADDSQSVVTETVNAASLTTSVDTTASQSV